MAKKKPVEQMSSDELFALAKNREAQERENEREANRAQIDALRQKRRDLVTKQRKELAAIDSKIRKLGGKTSTASRSGSRSSNVSKEVLTILKNKKQLSTKEIQAQLNKNGIEANNLSQTLAYLKRMGKISSPSRAIYTIK